ncbi:hypothetical protein [Billgrantia bachuensis]|uniref:Uncharacterized protein n=1 Tax=Billgrantia bachuensis TaxID=2717286 RepID=A0ABX0PRR0_9GAMM|nr:hypothetical protein [Halomonas bachuensis]NIC05266.1 hypothetical protein [Halomonas bachuensis]
MAITENGLLEYESGQAFNDWEEMSDSGDGQVFEASFAPWSGRSGFDTHVRPWGLATGGRVVPDAGVSDSVHVEALTLYMPGTATANADGLVAVASGEVSVGRATETDTHMVTSIVVTAGALSGETGLAGTSFSETRGAAGGPPLIPVDAIEIAQVRLSSLTAAEVVTTEIFSVPGVHQERYDFPVWSEDPASGEVSFATALPTIHVGELPKKVSVKGYTPIFAELPYCSDFVPADESHSVNSTDTYSGPLGSVSRTLGQASFTHRANDGITDPIVRLKNQRLWFRWFQDRNRAPFSLTRGILGIARQYPVGDHVTVNATISAEQATVDFDG